MVSGCCMENAVPSRIEYMCTIHAYMFRCVATSGLFVKFLKYLTNVVTAFTSLCEGLRTHEEVFQKYRIM